MFTSESPAGLGRPQTAGPTPRGSGSGGLGSGMGMRVDDDVLMLLSLVFLVTSSARADVLAVFPTLGHLWIFCSGCWQGNCWALEHVLSGSARKLTPHGEFLSHRRHELVAKCWKLILRCILEGPRGIVPQMPPVVTNSIVCMHQTCEMASPLSMSHYPVSYSWSKLTFQTRRAACKPLIRVLLSRRSAFQVTFAVASCLFFCLS